MFNNRSQISVLFCNNREFDSCSCCSLIHTNAQIQFLILQLQLLLCFWVCLCGSVCVMLSPHNACRPVQICIKHLSCFWWIFTLRPPNSQIVFIYQKTIWTWWNGRKTALLKTVCFVSWNMDFRAFLCRRKMWGKVNI